MISGNHPHPGRLTIFHKPIVYCAFTQQVNDKSIIFYGYIHIYPRAAAHN